MTELPKGRPSVPGVVLEEEIGRGGYASVYRAHQTSVNRKVAVKVDDRRLVEDRDRRRFTREVTSAGQVSAHPHIVTVYDGGITADQRPYLVMELCPGGSYSARMKQLGRIPLAEVLDVGFGIADALVAAHAEGILHRDVKPGNILITRYGTAALADFGLASLAGLSDQPSVTLESLTPAYAPPEAFSLAAPTAAGDVYSLGCTLYALLQGRPPRSDSTGSPPTVPRLLMLLNEPLPALAVSGTEAIMPVLWKATAPRLEQRFQTAAELRDAVAAARLGKVAHYSSLPTPAQGESTTTLGPTGSSTAGPDTVASIRRQLDASAAPPMAPVGRHLPRMALIAAAVVAVVLVAVIVLAIRGNRADGRATPGAADSTAAPTAAGSTTPVGTEQTSAVESSAPVSSVPVSSVPVSSAVGSSLVTSRPVSSPVGSSPVPSSGPVATTPVVGSCFSGIVTINVQRTAAKIPCARSHYWEAFATGVLSPSTTSPQLDEVVADPAVTATCTQQALKKYLGGRKSKGTFQIEVLPPREFDYLQGDRGFWCLTAEAGQGEVTGSLRG